MELTSHHKHIKKQLQVEQLLRQTSWRLAGGPLTTKTVRRPTQNRGGGKRGFQAGTCGPGRGRGGKGNFYGWGDLSWGVSGLSPRLGAQSWDPLRGRPAPRRVGGSLGGREGRWEAWTLPAESVHVLAQHRVERGCLSGCWASCKHLAVHPRLELTQPHSLVRTEGGSYCQGLTQPWGAKATAHQSVTKSGSVD